LSVFIYTLGARVRAPVSGPERLEASERAFTTKSWPVVKELMSPQVHHHGRSSSGFPSLRIGAILVQSSISALWWARRGQLVPM
jgi:hypothetical protein